MTLTKEKLADVYTTMKKIRLFEDKVAELFVDGQIPGFVHLYAGQEAMAAGVIGHLTERDYITSHHRGHGHCIAKGVDIKSMMAEIFGKATGCCRGKGGSMHVADVSKGMLGANGIVGAGGPLAVGAGLMAKTLGTGQVTVCFFGDGAAEQGTIHEAMNLACCWNLPVVFVCENNGFAESTPCSYHCAAKNISTAQRPMTCLVSRWMGLTFSPFMKRPEKPYPGHEGAKVLPSWSYAVFAIMATFWVTPCLRDRRRQSTQ